MVFNKSNTKCGVDTTSAFKKSYKKLIKQQKNLEKLKEVVIKLANKEELEPKYHNHSLINNKYFKNCSECHIEPDWLLIYRYEEDELILLLIDTGSHSEVF